MTDADFITLSPSEAYGFAATQSMPERARLFGLYSKARGVVPQPGLDSASLNADSEAIRAQVVGRPQSLMFLVGRACFILSLVLLFFLYREASNGNPGFGTFLLMWIIVSLIGGFALMWMLGALERRLIDINATLMNREIVDRTN